MSPIPPGACDNRINLYPAAPIRLAKVLLAWTIAQKHPPSE
jgi:hypothetical protein